MSSPGQHAHSFSLASLERRLREVTSTMQSIQEVSSWAIHHRKHAKTVVSAWYRDLLKAATSRRVTLLYLANDIVQNSKRKGPEYKAEFARLIPKALLVVSKEKDSSLQSAVQRILSVWEERKVFQDPVLRKFKAVASGAYRRTRSESDLKRPPPSAASIVPATTASASSSSIAPAATAAFTIAPATKRLKRSSSSGSPPLDARPNAREPPEPEDLLKKMYAVEGERSALQDTATRQKIASFPPEIHDPELLLRIKDRTAAHQLAEQVEEASKVLTAYNTRLEAEVKQRTEIQELLDVFIWQQKALLKEAKRKLKEHQGKLEKVTSVREGLRSHLASLPDISQLPGTSQGALAPLPSAGDLFT